MVNYAKILFMKVKIIMLLLFTLIMVSVVQAGDLEFQLSYGRWTMSPFVSFIERETENLIKSELTRLLAPILPRDVYSTFQSVDLSSSGEILAFSIWYNFGKSRFSLGLKGEYYDFKLPYSINSEQSVNIFDYQLIQMETKGQGEVSLNSVMFSLLSRWEIFSMSKFRFYLFGGLTLLPYNGEISLEQTTLLQTPVGDISYDGIYSETIKNIRSWDDSIPSLLISPAFGICLKYDLVKRLGIIVDIYISQGTFISAGLALRL